MPNGSNSAAMRGAAAEDTACQKRSGGVLPGADIAVSQLGEITYSPQHGDARSELRHRQPYLRAILRFIGIEDVTFVHLEGLKVSAEVAAKGCALADIDRLVQDRVLTVG